MSPEHKTDGFTIVEVAVIIVVISILVSIVYVSYEGSINKTSQSVLSEDLRRTSDQLKYERSQGKPYPASLDQLNDSKGPTLSKETTMSYVKTGDNFCLSAESNKRPNAGIFFITSASNSIESGGC